MILKGEYMMMRKIQAVKKGLVLLILTSVLPSVFFEEAGAATLGDVSIPDTVTIDNTRLQLNGAGYRTKFVFRIYVGALYTEDKVGSRDAVQTLKGPKRVLMHMVYDEVGHEKMADAWKEGFEENNSDAQLKKLRSRLQTFIGFFPDLKEGDIIYLDYIPGSGTRVTINDSVKGFVEGDDFYRALLDVWLGEEPADDELKAAMLGQAEE